MLRGVSVRGWGDKDVHGNRGGSYNRRVVSLTQQLNILRRMAVRFLTIKEGSYKYGEKTRMNCMVMD